MSAMLECDFVCERSFVCPKVVTPVLQMSGDWGKVEGVVQGHSS